MNYNKDYNSEDDEEVKTADEYFSKSDASKKGTTPLTDFKLI